jgi:hypothetical protein
MAALGGSGATSRCAPSSVLDSIESFRTCNRSLTDLAFVINCREKCTHPTHAHTEFVTTRCNELKVFVLDRIFGAFRCVLNDAGPAVLECCVRGFCGRACALRWAVGSSGRMGAVARARRFRLERAVSTTRHITVCELSSARYSEE